jgi:hypothetical protein
LSSAADAADAATRRRATTKRRPTPIHMRLGARWDAVVVGGGVVGAAVLRELTVVRRLRCLLVEASHNLVAGASSGKHGYRVHGIGCATGHARAFLPRRRHSSQSANLSGSGRAAPSERLAVCRAQRGRLRGPGTRAGHARRARRRERTGGLGGRGARTRTWPRRLGRWRAPRAWRDGGGSLARANVLPAPVPWQGGYEPGRLPPPRLFAPRLSHTRAFRVSATAARTRMARRS